jgi:hypothetical protein
MSQAPNLAAQEEARLAMAAVAARAERLNQPSILLYLAALLLLAALIFLGVEFRASLSASSHLSSEKSQAEETIQKAGRLKALREAAQAEPSLSQPATQVRTRIEQAGVDVGLKNRVPLPTTRTERPPGLGSMQTRFDYEVRDEDLQRLLQWTQKAVTDVPGLEVYSISLRPEAHQWILRVSFSRWERTEGS